MKKLVAHFSIIVLSLGVMMAVAALISGCETGGDTVALTVEPLFVDMTAENTNTAITQTFTVTGGLRELSLPLEWTVSDPNLGSIAAYGGQSASYVRTSAHGDNAIHVTDQYGAEGVATVRQ